MKIEIETVRVVTRGVAMRRVVTIQAFKTEELPSEYLCQGLHCQLTRGGEQLYISEGKDLILGMDYEEKEFQTIIEKVCLCAEKLTEINKRAVALVEAWKGIEKFVI